MTFPRLNTLAVLGCVGLAPATTALAQTRPLLTETARTAPARTLSLEAGVDFVADRPNFLSELPRNRWDAPTLRLTWSPADNVELDAEWVARITETGTGAASASDWGDVTLRAKVRLVGSADSASVLAARFGVTLADTPFGEGLGPNTLRMSAQLLFSRRLGRAELIANAGLALLDEPLRLHEQRDLFAYGLALTASAGRATLLAELVGLAGDGAPGVEARSEVRAGVRIPARRTTLDAALRRGVGDAAGGWGFTAGATWQFR